MKRKVPVLTCLRSLLWIELVTSRVAEVGLTE